MLLDLDGHGSSGIGAPPCLSSDEKAEGEGKGSLGRDVLDPQRLRLPKGKMMYKYLTNFCDEQEGDCLAPLIESVEALGWNFVAFTGTPTPGLYAILRKPCS